MPDLECSMTTDGGPGSGRYPKGSHEYKPGTEGRVSTAHATELDPRAMYWIHVGENESGKRGQELVSGEYLMARSKLHELKKGVPPPTAVAGGSISATRLSELADAHSKIASGHKEVGTLGRPTWHAQEAAKHEGYSNELRQMARSREEKTTGKLADNKVYEVSTKVGGKTVSMTLTGAYIKARDAVEAHGPTVRMFPIASNEEAMMRHSKSWLTKASEVNAHHADLHAAAAAHGRADYHQPKVEAFRAKSNYLKSLAEKRVDIKAPYKSKHRRGQDHSMTHDETAQALSMTQEQ